MAAGSIAEVIESMHVDIAGDGKHHLKIGTKLNKKEYRNINALLNAFGGKWHTGAQAHIFDYDPTERLLEVARNGVMPKLNPHAFFPTPYEVCAELLRYPDFDFFKYLVGKKKEDFRILEPSAGSGNFLDAAREVFGIDDLVYFNRIADCVEYDIENVKTLEKKGYAPVHGDFLAYNTDYTEKYDLILCNPPFSVDGDKKAYIAHIEHAHKMLKPSGILLFIAPTGFLTNKDKRTLAFCDLIAEHYMGHEELKKGTFAESGTNVATAAVYLSGNKLWGGTDYNGVKDVFVWKVRTAADYDERFYEEVDCMIKQKDNGKTEVREFVKHIVDTLRREYNFVPYSKMDEYIQEIQQEIQYRIDDLEEDTEGKYHIEPDIWNSSKDTETDSTCTRERKGVQLAFSF